MGKAKQKTKPVKGGRKTKPTKLASLNGHAGVNKKVADFDGAAAAKLIREEEGRRRVARLEAINALPVKQRVAAIMAEQLQLQHGVSTERWQELAAVQVEIAMRVDNNFGESTRAYLALIEAKKIDMAVAAKLGDWLAAANQAGANDGGSAKDDQLSTGEIAALAAGLAEQAPEVDDRPSHAGRLAVGQALGSDDRSGRPEQQGRRVAAAGAAGLDPQLADMRVKAIG